VIRVVLLAVLLAMLLAMLTISWAAPAEAVERRWHSCTVQYAVDRNGYSAMPLVAAITDIEAATGLDFDKVPWRWGDLKITIGGGKGSKNVGVTHYYRASVAKSARIKVYRLTYRQNWDVRVNVYRHELGHALGLNHVKGSDVMNRRMTMVRSATRWQAALQRRYAHCED
jgi:predicted Zn-dependent protease